MAQLFTSKLVNLCLALVIAAGCLFSTGVPTQAAAQVLSVNYAQDFDSLRSTGNGPWSDDSTLSGWYASRTTIAADSGGTAVGGMYSNGSAGSTERAFGSVPKKNSGGTIYKGVLLVNDTGQALTDLYVAYTGEQWRNSGNGAQVVVFSYQISPTAITSLTAGSWTTVAALNFNAVVTGGVASALNGNLPANQRRISGVVPVSIPAGSYIFLRWTDTDDQGADHGLAIDDLLVSRNQPPLASADAYSTPEDTLLTVAAPGVLGNDNDPEGNPLTAALVSQTANGVVEMNADGSFTYTPAANWYGTDSFTYTASDGILSSLPATVTLTVTTVNDAPVASFDSGETNEDTLLTVPATGVLGNDSDLDGDALTAALVVGPDHGDLILNADGGFTYTPDVDWNGSDSFTYTAFDGAAESNTATVTLTVVPVNDAPVAVEDTYSVPEDLSISMLPAAGVLANDTDVDGDSLSALLVSQPAHGTLTWYGYNGTFMYTPDVNWNGSDNFTYMASDGTLNSNTVTVTLNVQPVNDEPVAVADAYSLDEDSVLAITTRGVLDNDTDVEGDALTAVLDGSPLHGDLTLNADGSFSYTPDANWNGSDSFTYHAFDGQAASGTVTVTLTVHPLNDAPILLAALPDQTTLARRLYSFAAAAYFGDNDSGDVLSFTAESADGSALPAWLSIDAANGVLSGTPTNAQIGTNAIKVTASDGIASISDEFTLTVEINHFSIFLPVIKR